MTQDKSEHIDELHEQYNVPKSELKDLWKEFEEEQKKFGVDEDHLVESVRRRFNQYFAKEALRTRGMQKYDIVPYGVQVTDYGAQRQYDKVMDLVTEDGSMKDELVEQAIEEGMMNENREPLYHQNQQSQNYGEVIEPEEARTFIFDVAAREVTNDEEAEEFEGLQFQIGAKELSGKDVELFTAYEVDANYNESNKTIYGNRNSEFEKKFEMDKENATKILSNVISDDNKAKIKDLETYCELDERNQYNRTVLVRGDAVEVNQNRDGISNTMSVLDPEEPSEIATVWMSEHFDLDFSENAQDVWIYGTVNWKDDDEEAHINARGFFVDDMYRHQDAGDISLNEAIEQTETSDAVDDEELKEDENDNDTDDEWSF